MYEHILIMRLRDFLKASFEAEFMLSFKNCANVVTNFTKI